MQNNALSVVLDGRSCRCIGDACIYEFIRAVIKKSVKKLIENELKLATYLQNLGIFSALTLNREKYLCRTHGSQE